MNRTVAIASLVVAIAIAAAGVVHSQPGGGNKWPVRASVDAGL